MMAKNRDQFIGVFDSGVGGLTVLRKAMNALPNDHFLYYADSANTPYGTKKPEEITTLVDGSIMDMTKYPLKAVLLACNTATSVAVEFLRSKYQIPIIGMEPAVKPAVLAGDPRRILVLGTEMTIRSNKFHDLIKSLDATDQVDAIALPELVNFAEEFEFDSPAVHRYLREQLMDVNWMDYHSVVVGCTHFHYFENSLAKYARPQIHFVDGIEGTINQLINSIKTNKIGVPPKLKCMLSGIEVATEVLNPYLNYLNSKKTLFQSSLN